MDEDYNVIRSATYSVSLEKVIEYLYYDEKKHFEEVTGYDGDEETLIIKIHNAIIEDDWSEFPDGEHHIFTHLTTIAFWDRLIEQLEERL
tara:strand:- start:1222 stop:1491 length:270 start_codon:yes stop_codon:yes gene_type:complete